MHVARSVIARFRIIMLESWFLIWRVESVRIPITTKAFPEIPRMPSVRKTTVKIILSQ